SKVTRGASQVTLITDESFGTGVKILGSGQQAAVGADPNRPGQLQLRAVDNASKIRRGDRVVTSGSVDPKLASFYPMDQLVAAVGLLCGSQAGAAFGFAVGLLLDLALLQTLGVSSLLLVTIGYGAGRLRELRDPAHGLVPMAVGAVASAIATFGYAVLQFLL